MNPDNLINSFVSNTTIFLQAASYNDLKTVQDFLFVEKININVQNEVYNF
jgi:hypothetical protein